jgi:hypothetical protein
MGRRWDAVAELAAALANLAPAHRERLLESADECGDRDAEWPGRD